LVDVAGAGPAKPLETQPDFELFALVSLGPEIDLGAGQDEALTPLPLRRPPEFQTGLPAPEIDPRLLEVRGIGRVVDVTERIAVAEPDDQAVLDQQRRQMAYLPRFMRFCSSRRSSCRRSSSTCE
jgi:hypothetical protein